MDTVIIEGLHVCKPGNAPSVNQIKTFLVTEETSQRTGNQWTKIRSAAVDKGGRHYRIVSVRPTGTTDSHGNVSFNLELEEAQAPAQPQPLPPHPNQQYVPSQNAQPANANGSPAAPAAPPAYDTVEQHIMRSANLYNVCLSVAATVIRDCAQRKGLEFAPEDIRQIATTLYIQAKDNGYVAHMGDKEPQIKKAPY